MKNITFARLIVFTFACSLLLACMSCGPTTMKSFYSKYKKGGEAEIVSIPAGIGPMFSGLVNAKEDPEARLFLKKMKGIKIVSIEPAAGKIPEAREDLVRIMKMKKFEDIVAVSSEEELVRISILSKKRRKEVLIVSIDDKEISIVNFRTGFTDGDILKFLSMMNGDEDEKNRDDDGNDKEEEKKEEGQPNE